MRFPWIVVFVLACLFIYHSTGDTVTLNEKGKGRAVPIVFNYMDDAKRNALKRQQGPLAAQRLEEHEGLTLQVVVHGAVVHSQEGTDVDLLQAGVNATTDYIPEDEDPVHGSRRVKRWGRYGGHGGWYGGHHHHHPYHHQHHQPKPVSLDFGCNSDNYHEHLTKQHDASGSSDGTTSAPSSSSSSDDHQPLSLFIKRPYHQPQQHHHGPHLTFRCNAHNHHIFKHFRRRSK